MQIARRAYGQYTFVENVEGYVAANLRAMLLQAENQDGEYMVFKDDETPGQRPTVFAQSGLDWL